MKTLFALIMGLYLLVPGIGRTEVTQEDLKQIDQSFDRFVSTLNTHLYQQAYKDFMLPIDNQPDFTKQLVDLTAQVMKYYDGVPLKYEKIAENITGHNLVWRRYILYTDKSPYFIQVVMFRTSTGWKAQHITLRDLSPDDVAPK